MDPMSAIAIAGTAFNAIKAGFEHEREIEAMAGDMGRWMGAIKDVKDGANKKKKKMYGSIEEEAFEEFAALKEAERMEQELRQFVNMNYGPNAWNEVIRIQAEIRRKKKEAELEAKRIQRQKIENAVIGGCVLFFIFFIIYIVYLVMSV